MDRSLSRKIAGGSSGSASAGQALDLTAGKLTPGLSDRTADVRGRQWPTRCSRSISSKAALRSTSAASCLAASKLPFASCGSRPQAAARDVLENLAT
jgi:hypothetical protein